jgi:hypothetical protein
VVVFCALVEPGCSFLHLRRLLRCLFAVNEVGHNKAFRQNVYLADSLDGRVVRYYFMPDGGMEKGKPIELLTNYKSGYEGIRERKGYGLRNIREGVKSDDCIASRLQRNFGDREDAENMVDVTESIQRLSYLLKFIDAEIWKPIMDGIDSFKEAWHSGSEKMPLSPNQWVAARRIYWLVDVFRQKVERKKIATADKTLFQFYEREANKILERIDMRAATSFIGAMKLGHGVLGRNVADALDCELLEEICYDLRHKLHMVMDDAIYCPIAVRLIKTLCRHVAEVWLLRDGVGWDDEAHARQMILRSFYDAAIDSRNEILESVQKPELEFRDLQFTSGIHRSSFLSGNVDDVQRKVRSSSAFFLQNSTTPKGVIAALIEKLQYRDALSVAGLEPSVDGRAISIDIGDQLAMICFDGFDGHDNLKGLGSVPIHVSKIPKISARINEAWYIHWQVVFVVDTFASYYLEGGDYSLDELCAKLDVDVNHATFVTQRGLHQDDGERYRDVCVSKQMQPEVRAKQKTTTKLKVPNNVSKPIGGRTAAKLVYEGKPTAEFPLNGNAWPPGWIQKTYERASGASIGHRDNYWFPPEGTPKLRSYLEILRFLAAKGITNSN